MEKDMNSHTWRLSDPGMDLLERAGLAALSMALRAATETGVSIGGLQSAPTDLTPDSVTLRWTGTAKEAISNLVPWAWQVFDGVMFFPAIHDERDRAQWWARVQMHSGIMRTFLQHVNSQPKLEAVVRIVRPEEDKEVTVSFQPPAERINDPSKEVDPKTGRSKRTPVPSTTLRPHEDVEKLFDKEGKFRTDPVKLSNWVHPGIAGRYKGLEGSWKADAARSLLVMLAPTICLYQRLQGEGNNWIVVVPDVRDLTRFDRIRRRIHLSPEFIDVASLGDAGLRFLAEWSARDPRKELRTGCRVIAMGNVKYYQNQSIRKAVLDVSARICTVRRYRILQQVFPNHFVARKTAADAAPTDTPATPRRRRSKDKSSAPASVPSGVPEGFYKLPTGRGRIADNLVSSRPWYENLFVPLPWDADELERVRKNHRGMSTERLWFTALAYQRSKLMRLITEDDMWDVEAERVFVTAFWETLDSLYKQEAKAVRRGGSATVQKRWERLEGELYRSLIQAKTCPLLRAVIAGWFAKAGRQRAIREHTAAIWRLIDDADHWRKGRDLALLALASHRKRKVREGETSPAEITSIVKESE